MVGSWCSADDCFGGHSGGETPGPIPNPEAKPSSADGTAPGRVWESRTPPDSTYRKPILARQDGLSAFLASCISGLPHFWALTIESAGRRPGDAGRRIQFLQQVVR